jgi:hypothetical protein
MPIAAADAGHQHQKKRKRVRYVRSDLVSLENTRGMNSNPRQWFVRTKQLVFNLLHSATSYYL